MPRLLFGRRLAPGLRTVVAGGPAYVDRRCRACRWAVMAGSPGR